MAILLSSNIAMRLFSICIYSTYVCISHNIGQEYFATNLARFSLEIFILVSAVAINVDSYLDGKFGKPQPHVRKIS